MNEAIKQAIFDKITAYNTIIISRHIRPDGDAVGSTKGLAEVLHCTFPNKHIYVINEDYSSYMAFLGGENSLQEISDSEYETALQIVIDTATEDRISNSYFRKAKEIIKIDHHIDIKPYGDICWIEDFRSSACEMIADFCLTFKDKLTITKQAATYIYCGMVTDSGRFRFEGVCGETMRLAGAMLDYGVDAETLYAHLYIEDFDTLKLKSFVYDNLKISPNGVAYIYINEEIQNRFNLTLETASNVVSELNSIKGSLIWIAFIDNKAKNQIRVRLRSRFIAIDELANKYNGGGHKMAAGATVYSKQEIESLVNDADKILKEYKRTHEGWL